MGAPVLGRAAGGVRARPGAEDHVRGAPGPWPGGGRLAAGRTPATADLQRRAQRQVQPQLRRHRHPLGANPAHQPALRRGPAGASATATASGRVCSCRGSGQAAPAQARRSPGGRPVCQAGQASGAFQNAAGDPGRWLEAAGSPQAAAAGVSPHPFLLLGPGVGWGMPLEPHGGHHPPPVAACPGAPREEPSAQGGAGTLLTSGTAAWCIVRDQRVVCTKGISVPGVTSCVRTRLRPGDGRKREVTPALTLNINPASVCNSAVILV